MPMGTPGSISSTNPFNLYSAYLTAAWNDNLQVEAQGYAGGVLVYDIAYTLSATSPTFITFDYLGVDEVDFTSFGGTHHAGYNFNGTQFLMDNVAVSTNTPLNSLASLSSEIKPSGSPL